MIRPSVEARVVSVWNTLVIGLIGFAFMGGGGWLVYEETQHPPMHSAHLYAGIAVALLGALLIRPDPIFAVVGRVVVIATPFIPQFGRRVNSGEVTPPSDKGVL